LFKSSRKGPTENRAGSWPCGLKVFSVLIFWFFCIKTKETASAAMSGAKRLNMQVATVHCYEIASSFLTAMRIKTA